MKQSPIRKLRRDRSRANQDLALAKAAGDAARVGELEAEIKRMDREIAAIEQARAKG